MRGAKAYSALIKQHNSVSDRLTGKDGSGDGSSEIADAEEEFHKSISTLIFYHDPRGCQDSWGSVVWH